MKEMLVRNEGLSVKNLGKRVGAGSSDGAVGHLTSSRSSNTIIYHIFTLG